MTAEGTAAWNEHVAASTRRRTGETGTGRTVAPRDRRWPIWGFPTPPPAGTVFAVTDAAKPGEDGPKGLSLLPPHRTAAEIATGPVIEDLDVFLIDGLTDEEYEAFLRAIDS